MKVGIKQSIMYLTKKKIIRLLEKKRLYIRPLLEKSQINDVSLDLRLGTDFLVSVQGRDAYINASHNNPKYGEIDMFFQETRRRLGETFIVYPQQTVLASSLEYIKMPNDVLGIISVRSTYSRLGLSLTSIVQPGYTGCLSLELTNNNKNPINLTVGSCLFQIRFSQISGSQNYFSRERKFICQVRPFIPSFVNDTELVQLNNLWKLENEKNN